jgi:hypothetical protein
VIGSLQVREDLVALDALMPANGAKNRTDRPGPQWMVVWNLDPVVGGLGGFQGDGCRPAAPQLRDRAWE